jgi:hypothetical protein
MGGISDDLLFGVTMEEKDRLNELRARARHLNGLITAINANNKPARGAMWTRLKMKQDPSVKEERLIPWEPWEGWHYEQQHPVMHPNTRAMKNDLETKLAAISEELAILERKNRKSTLSTIRQIKLKEPS